MLHLPFDWKNPQADPLPHSPRPGQTLIEVVVKQREGHPQTDQFFRKGVQLWIPILLSRTIEPFYCPQHSGFTSIFDEKQFFCYKKEDLAHMKQSAPSTDIIFKLEPCTYTSLWYALKVVHSHLRFIGDKAGYLNEEFHVLVVSLIFMLF